MQGRSDSDALAEDDPPERLAAWLGSITDDAVRDLDLRLLGDLVRSERDGGRLRKILEILRVYALEAAEGGDWDAVASTIDAVQSVGSDSADRTIHVLASDTLQRLGASAAAQQALDALPGAASARADVLVAVLAAIGASSMPTIAQRWAAERQQVVRTRLERVVAAAGKAGRDGLRRLLASDAEAVEVRIAAVRLLELTSGTEHLSALEAALSDAHDGLRAEAFRALTASASDRASQGHHRPRHRPRQPRHAAVAALAAGGREEPVSCRCSSG